MKQTGVLILAILLGVAAVFLIHLYLKKATQEATQGQEMVNVVTAARDIPAGTVLDITMLNSDTKWPKKYLNPNTLAPKDMDLILGQVTQNPLKAGQAIQWSDIGTVSGGGELSAVIKAGERALTLSVDDVTGIAGLIRPNDHVDIIGTFTTPSEMRLPVTSIKPEDAAKALDYLARKGGDLEVAVTTLTLLQNVTVLATGNILGTTPATLIPAMTGMPGAPAGMPGRPPAMPMKSYNTVTVLVTPLECEIMVFAQEKGKLTLALRNPEDLETVPEDQLPKIVFTDIVKPELRKAVQEERTKRQIEVIKGGEIRRR